MPSEHHIAIIIYDKKQRNNFLFDLNLSKTFYYFRTDNTGMSLDNETNATTHTHTNPHTARETCLMY